MAVSAPVPGDPGALAVQQPGLVGPPADSHQTVAVWVEGALFTQGRAWTGAATSSPDHWPVQLLSSLTQQSPSVFAQSTNIGLLCAQHRSPCWDAAASNSACIVAGNPEDKQITRALFQSCRGS